ncbi:hypothetical protein KY346_00935 [Candidatus Woesearchaeota archaeon]|nr:hypothetical protein [Candidatus Woesearchaeota archaeon]
MPTLLESYDAEKETTLLSATWDNCSADISLVEIVEDEAQVLLNIKPGSNDQDAMHTVMMRWTRAPNRHVTPGKQIPKMDIYLDDIYQEICDALQKMRTTASYRKAESCSKEGYPVDDAVFRKILDAAKKQEFADVVCSGTSSYSDAIKNIAYSRVTVEFNKKPKAL